MYKNTAHRVGLFVQLQNDCETNTGRILRSKMVITLNLIIIIHIRVLQSNINYGHKSVLHCQN